VFGQFGPLNLRVYPSKGRIISVSQPFAFFPRFLAEHTSVSLSLNTISTAEISNASRSGPRSGTRTLGQDVEDLDGSHSPL
jgi:hypothetical protein